MKDANEEKTGGKFLPSFMTGVSTIFVALLLFTMSTTQYAYATGGYGVSKIEICAGSPVLDKTLSASQLRRHDVTVLAITRAERTMPNPPADTKIQLGDQLICFGKLQNIRDRTCMNP